MEEGKKTILIVDDDADIRLFLGFSLKKAGYAVLEAGNGAKALDLLKDHAPDLIVTDAMMPVLDGHGLIRALKADAAWSRIPVILLTGRDGEETGEGRDRPDARMGKPVVAGEILAVIKRLLTNP